MSDIKYIQRSASISCPQSSLSSTVAGIGAISSSVLWLIYVTKARPTNGLHHHILPVPVLAQFASRGNIAKWVFPHPSNSRLWLLVHSLSPPSFFSLLRPGSKAGLMNGVFSLLFFSLSVLSWRTKGEASLHGQEREDKQEKGLLCWPKQVRTVYVLHL